MEIIIKYNNGERLVKSDSPILLSDVMRKARLSAQMPCGGNGSCGKCTVLYAKNEDLGAPKSVLACQTRAVSDCTIWVDADIKHDVLVSGSFVNGNNAPLATKLGAAVDIGTTTLAAYLYDVECGEIINNAAAANGQCVFGLDVISRIEAALAGESGSLSEIIIKNISSLLDTLCQSCRHEEIDTIVLTGNTAMLYMLAGVDLSPLAAAPFEIAERFGRFLDIDIPGYETARVYVPGCISAYVGADLACAVLNSGICQKGQTALLADIGTNGEIALWHNGKLYCCSTAAGPAFEGAGICCGMSASPGAVDTVYIKDKQIRYTVIADAKPKGLCASGLIDAVTAGLELGHIESSGYIEDGSIDIIKGKVFINQQDIRAVQLAKAAISAGINCLMANVGIDIEDIEVLYLAGGFGHKMNLNSAKRIGLIPNVPNQRIVQLGNAAGMGAAMIVADTGALDECEGISKNAKALQLAASPLFSQLYIENMEF